MERSGLTAARKVIVIVGPTCSGKTDLSLQLAEKLNTEIISADSKQVFKYLNIGTAKPNKNYRNKIKHHFIDNLEPDEYFNVSIFENQSLKVIEDLFKKEKIPIVVGGSGLYVKALVDGIFNSVDSDEQIRGQLQRKKEEFGIEYLYEELKSVDPKSAEKMLPQNYKRVMRALEVYYLTGQTIDKHQEKYKRELNIDFKQYGLMWDRKKLYENIENRVDMMIQNGLVDEVNSILKRGYSKELNALNTVGYKEVISFLENDIEYEKMIDLIKRNTRRFAKRQLTWFRADKRIYWYDINDKSEFEIITDDIIKREKLDER